MCDYIQHTHKKHQAKTGYAIQHLEGAGRKIRGLRSFQTTFRKVKASLRNRQPEDRRKKRKNKIPNFECVLVTFSVAMIKRRNRDILEEEMIIWA